MWLNRFLKGREKSESNEEERNEPTVNQGIFYLYLIIFMQVVFVFGLVAVIMFVGKVIATPLWVFLIAFVLGLAGCVYIYRKAKQQFQKLRETFQRVDLSDKNYEISFMGGVFTMRVEQSPHRQLLEAPSNNILEAETVRTQPAR
jgi:uncharacterized protein (DUF983 family)